MSFGIAILRAVVGGLFIGHGLQKLLGKFGGHGLDGTAGFFESLGLRPGKVHATAAGLAETGGGALLLAGAATPLGAAAVTGTMTVAIEKVHRPKGPWVSDGGYEYNAVLIAAMLALTETGPGRPSVDAGAFPRLKGNGLALAQFAAAAAGATLLTADRGPAVEEVPGEDEVTAPRHERFTREPAQVETQA